MGKSLSKIFKYPRLNGEKELLNNKRKLINLKNEMSSNKKAKLEDSNEMVNWKRPEKKFDTNKRIILQILEYDFYTNNEMEEIMRIYGSTQTGNSLIIHVNGFYNYTYLSVPENFTESQIEEFKEALNNFLKSANPDNTNNKDPITDIELTHKLVDNSTEMTKMLKISYTIPCLNLQLNKIIRTKELIPGINFKRSKIYENNIDYKLKFVLDLKISGCCWIELPAMTCTERPNESNCQAELNVNFRNIVTRRDIGETLIAPFRILALDIECNVRGIIFSHHKHDKVLQIANIVSNQGNKDPLLKVIFTLKSCAPITNCQVLSFENESEMLIAWRDFLLELDPDILIGYNIKKFDLTYLIKRAEFLGIEDFSCFGRIRGVKTVLDGMKINGRIVLDLLLQIRRDFHLDSFKLQNVCITFLNESKDDVHFTEIAELQRGNEETRRKLANYCLKDAYLCLQLLNYFKYIEKYMAHSRVTGIPLSKLLECGMSIKNTMHSLKQAKLANSVKTLYAN